MASLPNFLIVGAVKAGTTSLYEYLSQHPDVFMPDLKEPHYFTRLVPPPPPAMLEEYVRDPIQYARLFEDAGQAKAIGEASPSYLWCPEAPRRIREELGPVRIIAILREPIDRVYSHFLMDVRDRRQKQSFLRALQEDLAKTPKGWWVSALYVELGLYREQLERYFELFGSERVLVLFHDELTASAPATLRRIAEFLEIDVDAVDSIDFSRTHNPYRKVRGPLAGWILDRRVFQAIGALVPLRWKRLIQERILTAPAPKPPPDPAAVELLREIYEPEHTALEETLGMSLPWPPPGKVDPGG